MRGEDHKTVAVCFSILVDTRKAGGGVKTRDSLFGQLEAQGLRASLLSLLLRD